MCETVDLTAPATPSHLSYLRRLFAVPAARAPAGLERGGDRSAGPAGGRAAYAALARRLDEVEKVLSRWDEVLAVVAAYVRPVAVQGVQKSDREDLGHAFADLVGRE